MNKIYIMQEPPHILSNQETNNFRGNDLMKVITELFGNSPVCGDVKKFILENKELLKKTARSNKFGIEEGSTAFHILAKKSFDTTVVAAYKYQFGMFRDIFADVQKTTKCIYDHLNDEELLNALREINIVEKLANNKTALEIAKEEPENKEMVAILEKIKSAQPPPVIDNTTPVQEPPVIDGATPVQEPPVIDSVTPVQEPPVIDGATPVQEPPVIDGATPAQEPPVIDSVTPVQEPPVIDGATPAQEPPVIDGATPAQEPPVIDTTPQTQEPEEIDDNKDILTFKINKDVIIEETEDPTRKIIKIKSKKNSTDKGYKITRPKTKKTREPMTGGRKKRRSTKRSKRRKRKTAKK
jgi:hypothetical protein